MLVKRGLILTPQLLSQLRQFRETVLDNWPKPFTDSAEVQSLLWPHVQEICAQLQHHSPKMSQRRKNLWNEEQLRLSALHLDAGEVIPLHDHPESVGLVLVTKGELQADQYDRPLAAQAGQPIHLRNHQRLILTAGNASLTLPRRQNMHELKAITEVSGFSMLIGDDFKQKRHWYLKMPTQNQNPNQRNMAIPVEEQTLRDKLNASQKQPPRTAIKASAVPRLTDAMLDHDDSGYSSPLRQGVLRRSRGS